MYYLSKIIILFILAKTAKTQSPCDEEACSGPFALKNVVIDTEYSKSVFYKGVIIKYEHETQGTIIEKEKYQLYCYNGGAFDPNTGCFDRHKKYYVNEDESKHKVCYITKKDRPGESVGGSSDKCFVKEDVLTTNIDFEYYGWRGSAPFARHMCVTDWKCKIKNFSLPIFVDSNLNIYSYFQNSSKFNIERLDTKCFNNFCNFYKIYYLEPGFSFILDTKINATLKDYEAECFRNEKMKSSICSIKKSELSEIIGMTFQHNDESTDGFMLKEGYFIKYIDKPIKISSSMHGLKTKLGNFYQTNDQKSASIDDIMKVQNEIMYTMSETHHNVAFLNMHINILHNVINKIIKSVSKIDDELVSNIINKKGKSKWLNKDIFNLCPCFDEKMDSSENCKGDFIFKNGRITQKTEENTKYCAKFDYKNVKNIDYFSDDDEIVINELMYPPPKGTSSDWDGWSWMASEKDNVNNAITFSTTTSNSNIFQTLFDENGSFWIKYKFIFTTSFFVYLNMLLTIFLLLTK